MDTSCKGNGCHRFLPAWDLFLFMKCIIFSLSCILHQFFKLPLKTVLTCFFVVLGKYLSWTLPAHAKLVASGGGDTLF